MPNKWSQEFISFNLYVCYAIYLAPYALRPVEGATLDLDVGQCRLECLPHRDLKVQHSLLDSCWIRQKTLNLKKKWNVINDQYGLACLVFSRLQLQYRLCRFTYWVTQYGITERLSCGITEWLAGGITERLSLERKVLIPRRCRYKFSCNENVCVHNH